MSSSRLAKEVVEEAAQSITLSHDTSSPATRKRIPRTAEEQKQWELSGGAFTRGLLDLPQGGRPDWSKEPPHIQKWAKEQGLM